MLCGEITWQMGSSKNEEGYTPRGVFAAGIFLGVELVLDPSTREPKQFHTGYFGGTDETIISEQFDRPVMIHRWPAEIKAFYMKRDPQNEKLSLGVDMIAPEGFGEIIGGGQREDDHDTLLKRIKEHKLPIEPFQWYLDLRKYGSVPHSGFGLGIERTVGWICGTKHIRETIPYPRTMYRIEP